MDVLRLNGAGIGLEGAPAVIVPHVREGTEHQPARHRGAALLSVLRADLHVAPRGAGDLLLGLRRGVVDQRRAALVQALRGVREHTGHNIAGGVQAERPSGEPDPVLALGFRRGALIDQPIPLFRGQRLVSVVFHRCALPSGLVFKTADFRHIGARRAHRCSPISPDRDLRDLQRLPARSGELLHHRRLRLAIGRPRLRLLMDIEAHRDVRVDTVRHVRKAALSSFGATETNHRVARPFFFVDLHRSRLDHAQD